MNSIKNRAAPKKEKQAMGEYPKLMTEKQASAYLGVSLSLLRKGRSEGQHGKRTEMPKYTRVGGRIFYRHSELDRWESALTAYSNLAEEGVRSDG